jgi:diguanylate cyclase (GGDEF)-like protein/PAS domain S-box-containing protein
MGDPNAPKRRAAESSEPQFAIADSTAQARRHVWHLLLIALAAVAVPLIIGGFALRQAAQSQRGLIESRQLAHASVVSAHVTGAVLDMRKDTNTLSNAAQTGSVLARRDAEAAQRLLDAARAMSPYYRALKLEDASDVVLAVSPADAASVFDGLPLAPTSTPELAQARVDGSDTVWAVRFTVRDAGGRRVGSVTAAFSLGRILRDEDASTAGQSGALSLVDPEGNFLVSTDASLSGKKLQDDDLLSLLQSGKQATRYYRSDLKQRDEFAALVPVTQLPMVVVLSSASAEIEAPLVLLERWLWLGFLALVVSSAGMIARALWSFRHYDRRLLRECGLATGVIEGTSDMVWVKDASGRYLLVNEPGAEFLHHTKDEIVGRTDTEVMSEQDAARTLKYDREVLDTGRPTKREVSGTDPRTGKPYVVWTARHPLRNRRGDIAAVVGVTRDVTERNRLVAALRAGEQRLRLVADNIPALVAYIDRDERFDFVNAKVIEAIGAGVASPIGRTLREVSGEEVYRDIAPNVAIALRGEMATFESRFSIKGRQMLLRTTYVPDVAPEGEVRGFYSVAFDVTDFKTIEMLLAASEAKLRLISDNLPALVAYIDVSRRFSFNNATYAQWLQRPVGEITGRRLDEVMPPQLSSLIEPSLEEAFKGLPVEFEFSWPGSERHLHGTFIPDRGAAGDVVGIYSLIYDITTQKATEARLREQAQVDSLTGLPNRRALRKRLAEGIARSQRYGHPLAVMFLDMDNLKTINDTRGHEGGDLALKEFARRLVASVRDSDVVARLSGDEFVVVLEAVEDAGAATAVAEHIAANLREPFDILGSQHTLSASIGVSFRRPMETDLDELLRRADHALYEAKNAGRGRCVVRP